MQSQAMDWGRRETVDTLNEGARFFRHDECLAVRTYMNEIL
jgi:hypothetical protein